MQRIPGKNFLSIIFIVASVASAVRVSYEANENKFISCSVEKLYFPSALETYWYEHINKLATNDSAWKPGCAKMKEFESEVRYALKIWDDRKEMTKLPDLGASQPRSFNKSIISYFLIEEKCAGKPVVTAEVPIEPLIGFLRHPLHHCIEQSMKLNKNYMYPTFNHEIYPTVKRSVKGKQNYYFDLGASSYTTGLGGASQKWFVDTYAAQGIIFDRLLLWEVKPIQPADFFSEVPLEVYGKVSYYNVPAQMSLNAPGNPIRILKQISHIEDFVMLKIDIDNETLEIAFIKQILSDPEVFSLIDELYFEHHVDYNPMNYQGWGMQKKLMNITESYDLFMQLRDRGIRAHSWV